MQKPELTKDKIKSGLQRATFLFIALLFVISAVGIGLYYFWQATHPPKNDTSQQANACLFDIVQNVETLPDPETFKPAGDVTKLETTDIEVGTGQSAKAGDCLTVKYYGTLASNGQKFDGDFDTPSALKFPFGQGQVIPGWDEGLVGMKVGGIRRLVIPSDLAYGSQSTGSIPASSDLVFVVKLLAIE